MTKTQAIAETRLQGYWLVIARGLWLMLVGPMALAFILGVPVRFNFLHHITPPTTAEPFTNFINLPVDLIRGFTGALGPAEAEALAQLGLSPEIYAAIILAFEILLFLVSLSIGSVLFWQRSDDWLALWFSCMIVLAGASAVSLVVPSLMVTSPFWSAVHLIVSFAGMLSCLHVLFLSPDGRIAPRWGVFVASSISGYMFGLAMYVGVMYARVNYTALIFMIFPGWVLGLGLGMYAQVHRYRHLSTAHQRQQTKWVVVGLAALTLAFLINGWLLSLAGQQPGLPRVLYSLSRTALVTLAMLFFPICVAFAVLRYRLWDVDLLIRRTLQYSVFSGLLALAYYVSITVLQRLFFANQQSQISIVLSTLAIAALFFPLRNCMQEFIDKRFFRKKYDAQKVLAEFAATCRDETDLDKLVARLVEVINETLQPETVSVWIKDDAKLRSDKADY